MTEDQTMLREVEPLRRPLTETETAFAPTFGDEVSPCGTCVALAAKEEDEDFDDDDFDDGFDDDFEEDFDDDLDEDDDFDDEDEDDDDEEDEDEEDFEE
jgi:hypothetical protein